MKSFCLGPIFLFLILMLVYPCSYAQDYLVTSKGDTIRGTIKSLRFGAEEKVQVNSADKKKVVYSIFQVKSYTLKNDVYHPVKGPGGYTFMKLIAGSYLSLYAFPLENQTTYDGLYLFKRDGRGIEVPNLAFKKIMKNFLADCPDVVAKIDEGILSKKELTLIVSEYNTCIHQKTATLDHAIVQQVEQTKKIDVWNILEEKVKLQHDFKGKTDALEMIQEIKHKISTAASIPNFLVEGLKASLYETDVKAELEQALKEIN